MKTIRNLALYFALVGTSVSSLCNSIEVSDPTVAGSETLSLMKTKRSTHDVNKMDNPILSVNKMDNPILSVNKMDNPILSVNKMDNPILSVNKMDNPILSVNKMDNPILSPLEF